MDKHTTKGRHQLILDDPCNTRITRVKDAGKIKKTKDGLQYLVMHNGIKVLTWPYGQEYGQIFIENKGVHEPQEEVVFGEVLKTIPENGTMIEVGAWWAFYSLWFNKEVKGASNYMIEPVSEYLEEGKRNFELNKAVGDFTIGKIGEITIDDFIKQKNIKFVDILHADVQGYELLLLLGSSNLIKTKSLNYIFISTHSQALHLACKEFLEKNGMKIVADADYDNDTYCCDGILVATFNQDFPIIDIGSYEKNKNK